MAKVERDPKVRNDDSLKGPTAAHRGRWLLETIGNLVRRIESPSSNEGERERAIGDINRTWLALASPYTADKLLREVLIQALQHAASPEVASSDDGDTPPPIDPEDARARFLAYLEGTHPDHAARLAGQPERVDGWIEAFARSKWNAVNDAAMALGAPQVEPESIRRDHQKWNEHFGRSNRGR